MIFHGFNSLSIMFQSTAARWGGAMKKNFIEFAVLPTPLFPPEGGKSQTTKEFLMKKSKKLNFHKQI